MITKEDYYEGETTLEAVWAMKHRKDIKTQCAYKWKARLNIHGIQQEHGRNYTKTYSPLVT